MEHSTEIALLTKQTSKLEYLENQLLDLARTKSSEELGSPPTGEDLRRYTETIRRLKDELLQAKEYPSELLVNKYPVVHSTLKIMFLVI